MRRLAENPAVPPASFDLATCTYDSLNYLLTHDDLLACFQGIAHALAPGGLFVGDMNTRHFLEFDWGTCEVQEHSSYVQVGQSHFDPADCTSTLVLTGFIGDDEGATSASTRSTSSAPTTNRPWKICCARLALSSRAPTTRSPSSRRMSAPSASCGLPAEAAGRGNLG